MAPKKTEKNVSYEDVGLTSKEYERIKELMGREPNELELSMFGVMWSEHCSYKNSKPLLKNFPTEGEHLIQGPGENAGVIDIGHGQALAFKIESHNHPSAIEPYQGAATGVGGILRDIFSMGARPIALLNSLRFGPLEKDRVKFLFEGVVEGIGGYGNCVGVPTVGGEVYFDPSYEENPLVNAMCVGLVSKEKIRKGYASGIGNSLLLVGAKTGRDGIAGASFASEELSEDLGEDRPAVQVGDPFMGKLLLEACQEIIDIPEVVGVQDLGAAGLTSSASEMASRAGTGVIIETENVPRREENMSPYEIMLSESQERMLIVVEKGKEDLVKNAVEKWNLSATKIGEVTKDKKLVVKDGEKVEAEVPVSVLVDEVMEYEREVSVPSYINKIKPQSQTDFNKRIKENILKDKNIQETFFELLGSPNVTCKSWVYSQFDYMVRTSTVIPPGGDASLVRIRGTNKGVALSVDGNSRFVYLDPIEGGKIAVAEAFRNVVCTGAKPMAITNCLNFGSPEKQEGYYQLYGAIKGISKACKKLKTPVTGGNVSLYNESHKGQIKPTPVIGMVGLLEDLDNRLLSYFQAPGEIIVLLGETKEEFGGSEVMNYFLEKTEGSPPGIDLEKELRLGELVNQASEEVLLSSAHDLSDGGLAISLAECCVRSELGAQIHLKKEDLFTLLFSESQSRILVSLQENNIYKLENMAKEKNIGMHVLGKVSEKEKGLVIKGKDENIDLSIENIKSKWRGLLPCVMR